MAAPSPTPFTLSHDSSLRDQPFAIAGIVLACSIVALILAVVAGIRLRALSRKEQDMPAASLCTEQPVACDSLCTIGAVGRPCEEGDIRETPSRIANQTTVQVDVHEDGRVSSPELDIPTIIYEEAYSYKFTRSVSDFSSLSEGSCTRLQEAEGTSYTLQLTELVSTNT